ncbi:helix-turn-helix domain-containing protein [Paenibacillus sp. FSL K6-1230]|uniref:helix-turn-helix domain-containing protein n=1 Tax=Paenibacillus sp. FSL K6-1230 TaxID=2921603 RepID=UPI0030F5C4B3
MNDNNKLGEMIKTARNKKGLTLVQLGKILDYSNPYLSQIENGKREKAPSPDFLAKLVEPLDLSYPKLLSAAGYEKLALQYSAFLEHTLADVEKILLSLPSMKKEDVLKLEIEYKQYFGEDFSISRKNLEKLADYSIVNEKARELINALFALSNTSVPPDQSAIDDFFEGNSGSVEVIFREDRYEKTVDSNGVVHTTVISNEELTQRFFDIKYLLEHRKQAFYNGHELTDEDRKRVLGMLDILLQEKSSNPAKSEK